MKKNEIEIDRSGTELIIDPGSKITQSDQQSTSTTINTIQRLFFSIYSIRIR